MEENKITKEEEVIVEAEAAVEAQEVLPEVVAETISAEAPIAAPIEAAKVDAVAPRDQRDARGARNQNNRGGRPGGRGGSRPRAPREKPEFDSKMISIRRVTRVVSGGRRFSLSVALVAGDRNGRIGLGTGKAQDTQLAIEKAMKQAKRNMITLKLTKNKAIPHDVAAKYNSSTVTIMPNKGKGLIAGSSARVIFALAGVKDVTAKFNSGSKNKLNNARATMKALHEIAYAHGESPVEVTKMVEAPVVAEVK